MDCRCRGAVGAFLHHLHHNTFPNVVLYRGAALLALEYVARLAVDGGSATLCQFITIHSLGTAAQEAGLVVLHLVPAYAFAVHVVLVIDDDVYNLIAIHSHPFLALLLFGAGNLAALQAAVVVPPGGVVDAQVAAIIHALDNATLCAVAGILATWCR